MKKNFLIHVGAAAAILASHTVLANVDTVEKQLTLDKDLNNLLMQNNTSSEILMVAAHRSHSSHGSHGSHGSHRSGY